MKEQTAKANNDGAQQIVVYKPAKPYGKLHQ